MYILINLKHNEPFIYRELHRHRIMERVERKYKYGNGTNHNLRRKKKKWPTLFSRLTADSLSLSL